MNILPNDEKLRKYLDELADEYKNLLFSSLILRSKSLDNVNLTELLRLDNEIKKPLFQDYYIQQKRRRLFFSSGLIYVFIGLLGYIFSKIITKGFLYNIEDVISLVFVVIGLVGLFICFYSFVFPTFNMFLKKNEPEQRNYIALLEYGVVAKWRDLEEFVSDISLSMGKNTPRSVIEFLISNEFIDEKEYITLREFLKMRNNIVHFTDNIYSVSEMKNMIENVNKIIEKINK